MYKTSFCVVVMVFIVSCGESRTVKYDQEYKNNNYHSEYINKDKIENLRQEYDISYLQGYYDSIRFIVDNPNAMKSVFTNNEKYSKGYHQGIEDASLLEERQRMEGDKMIKLLTDKINQLEVSK